MGPQLQERRELVMALLLESRSVSEKDMSPIFGLCWVLQNQNSVMQIFSPQLFSTFDGMHVLFVSLFLVFFFSLCVFLFSSFLSLGLFPFSSRPAIRMLHVKGIRRFPETT